MDENIDISQPSRHPPLPLSDQDYPGPSPLASHHHIGLFGHHHHHHHQPQASSNAKVPKQGASLLAGLPNHHSTEVHLPKPLTAIATLRAPQVKKKKANSILHGA